MRVLNIGFPLLSLPPGTFGGGKSSATRRVLAPMAFIPVSVTVKRGAATSIELACKGEGVDRVVPNTALFAWLEQQTGKSPADGDDELPDTSPWEEICSIVRGVCATLDLAVPELFETPAEELPADDVPKKREDGEPDAQSSVSDSAVDDSPSTVESALPSVRKQRRVRRHPGRLFK